MKYATFGCTALTLWYLLVVVVAPSVQSHREEERFSPDESTRGFDKRFSDFVKKIDNSASPQQIELYKSRLIKDLEDLEAEDRDYYDCLKACEGSSSSNKEEFKETVCTEGYCNRYVNSLKS